MSTEKNKTNVTVVLNAINFNEHGEVLNAIDASAKLTKADAGRVPNGDEDYISINASTCDTPTIEANYQGQTAGKGEVSTTLELDLKGKVFNEEQQELVNALTAKAKLVKEEQGNDEAVLTKDWYRLKAVKNTDSGCASIESNYNTKSMSI